MICDLHGITIKALDLVFAFLNESCGGYAAGKPREERGAMRLHRESYCHCCASVLPPQLESTSHRSSLMHHSWSRGSIVSQSHRFSKSSQSTDFPTRPRSCSTWAPSEDSLACSALARRHLLVGWGPAPPLSSSRCRRLRRRRSPHAPRRRPVHAPHVAVGPGIASTEPCSAG